MPGFDGHHNRIFNEAFYAASSGEDVSVNCVSKRLKSLCMSRGVKLLNGSWRSVIQDYDVVHLHDMMSLAICAGQFGGPSMPVFVLGVHFMPSVLPNGLQIPTTVDGVICVSEAVKQEVDVDCPDMADVSTCIHTGVPLEKYRFSIPSSVTVGAYVNNSVTKGLDVLLDAARALPSIQFHVVGNIGDRPLPDNVKSLGFLENEDMRAWLESVSIFVCPSKVEALGTTLIEASLSGCALVGSTTGGVSEVVVHGVTGELFEVGNADALAGVISGLVNNADNRVEYAKAACVRSERLFGAQMMSDKVLDFYRRCIKAKHGDLNGRTS